MNAFFILWPCYGLLYTQGGQFRIISSSELFLISEWFHQKIYMHNIRFGPHSAAAWTRPLSVSTAWLLWKHYSQTVTSHQSSFSSASMSNEATDVTRVLISGASVCCCVGSVLCVFCAGKSKALPAVRAPVKGSVSANHTPSPDEDTQRDSRALAVRHSRH